MKRNKNDEYPRVCLVEYMQQCNQLYSHRQATRVHRCHGHSSVGHDVFKESKELN